MGQGRYETHEGPKTHRFHHRTVIIFLVIVILLLITGLIIAVVVLQNNQKVDSNVNTNDTQCKTDTCYAASSIILGSINVSANPCDDFYQYACGSWLAKNDLPDDQVTITTFSGVAEKNEKVLRRVLAANYATQSGQGEQKAIKYYQSCVNDKHTEKESRPELINMIKDLGGWSVVPSIMPVDFNTWQYNPVLAKIVSKYDINPLFNTWIDSDLKNSKETVVSMTQSGLSLPGVQFYLIPETHAVVVAFVEYMTDVAMIMGATNRTLTKEKMTEVYRFEKQLARAFIHNLNQRNEIADYYKSSIVGMNAACPAIDFNGYLNMLIGKTLPNNQPIVVYTLNYFKRMSVIVSNTPNEVLNNYLLWHFMKTFTSAADSKLVAAYDKYRERLYGKARSAPLWKTCVYRTNAALGMAVGAMFVRQSFPMESRTLAKSMVEDVRAEFIRNLPSISWLDSATRKVVAKKAQAIIAEIGYPNFILNQAELAQYYSSFPVNESYYFINVVNGRKFTKSINLAQLGKPFDRTSWLIAPATVNPFYNSPKNQIVFPAGILQSPAYDVNYLKAINFGAIGTLIGHEITHGFDNAGRLYNQDGELVQWWNNATIRRFNARNRCFIDQYNAYTYFGVKVNGILSLNENIADNGGVGQAFRAYQAYIKKYGEEPTLPGVPLTNEQLFFVSFARNWCGKDTPQFGIGQALSSRYSPRIYRVLGSLHNSQEFAKAFNCPSGSPMNPVKKCKMW